MTREQAKVQQLERDVSSSQDKIKYVTEQLKQSEAETQALQDKLALCKSEAQNDKAEMVKLHTNLG